MFNQLCSSSVDIIADISHLSKHQGLEGGKKVKNRCPLLQVAAPYMRRNKQSVHVKPFYTSLCVLNIN